MPSQFQAFHQSSAALASQEGRKTRGVILPFYDLHHSGLPVTALHTEQRTKPKKLRRQRLPPLNSKISISRSVYKAYFRAELDLLMQRVWKRSHPSKGYRYTIPLAPCSRNLFLSLFPASHFGHLQPAGKDQECYRLSGPR